MIVKGRNFIKTKGGILFMENKEKLLKMLNNALAREHACQIRYLTHAAVIAGPYAELVAKTSISSLIAIGIQR